MHESMFHVQTDGCGTSIDWGGSQGSPSWICRVDPRADNDKEPIPWGELPLFNSDQSVTPREILATPMHFKGGLRTATLGRHFLKLCTGCHHFFVSRRKWEGICSGCHDSLFCSVECHKASWGRHQATCRGTTHMAPADRSVAELCKERGRSAQQVINNLRKANKMLLEHMHKK